MALPNVTLAELYDRNATYWDSALYRLAYFGAYVRLFRQLMREGVLSQPQRVLDCGIGAGILSEALARAADTPVQLHGVDLSPKLLAVAAAKFRAQGVAAEFALADIRQLPYRDERMDAVVSALVLEHVPEPVDAIKEMARVLRRQRMLLIVATRQGAPDHYFRRKYHYQPYSPEAILTWLRTTGLQHVRAYDLLGIGRLFARAYTGVKA